MILKKTRLVLILGLCFFSTQSQSLDKLAEEFLNSLDPELRLKAIFDLKDGERYNFNYVPVFRKGPTFRDFDATQKEAALQLLRASVSKEGYLKAYEIMQLEAALAVLENNSRTMADGSPMRDVLNYHFCIFGKPDTGQFWGWRFEGHHLSLNFVASAGKIVASTPSFMGSNPGKVPSGPEKGKEVLKQETELGFQLVNALSDNQLAIARFSDTAPNDIFTRNQKEADKLEPRGIFYPDLSEEQKAVYTNLLQLYLDNYEAQFSKSLKTKIEEAGMEKLSFAWAGSLEPGAGHYYRLQGPTLLIEYDNTQNNANHVHTVVRDLTNDFGEDVLKRHYDEDHN